MPHLSANTIRTLTDVHINKYIYTDSAVKLQSDIVVNVLLCLFPTFNDI